MAKPKTNPIREERRKVLGDWTAFCLECGWAQRWFEGGEAELPAACPHCQGELRHRCPACSAPFSSTFATTCEECDAPLREGTLFGMKIRKED